MTTSINETSIKGAKYAYINSATGKELRLNREGKEARIKEIDEFLLDSGMHDLKIHVRPANGDFNNPVQGVICSNNFIRAELCPNCDAFNLSYNPLTSPQYKCLNCDHSWEKQSGRGRPSGSKSNQTAVSAVRGIKPDRTWIRSEQQFTETLTRHEFALITLYRGIQNFFPEVSNLDAKEIKLIKGLFQSNKIKPETKYFLEDLLDCFEIGEKIEGRKKRLDDLKKLKAEQLTKKSKVDQCIALGTDVGMEKEKLEPMIEMSQDLLAQIQALTNEIQELQAMLG